jgi:hypothetical protein
MIPRGAHAGYTKYKTTTEIIRKRDEKTAVRTCMKSTKYDEE